MKGIYVEWIDHYNDNNNWQQKDVAVTDFKPAPCSQCKTLGFLIHETKDWLRVSISISAGGRDCESILHIYKKCITKRKFINLKGVVPK